MTLNYDNVLFTSVKTRSNFDALYHGKGFQPPLILVWTVFRTSSVHLPLTLSLFLGECKVSDTRFFTPSVRPCLASTHERFSLPHRPASTQQGISHSYSIRLPCCSASRPSRPKKSGSLLRGPTTCSVRRPVFLTFTCVPLSYSSPGSFAVTDLRVRYIFRSPSRYSSGSAKCQASGSLLLALLGAFLTFSSSVWRRFP